MSKNKYIKGFMLTPLKEYKSRRDFVTDEEYLRYKHEAEKSIGIVARSWAIIIFGVILFIILVTGLGFTVEAGEIGVVTRFGEVQRVADSGFNFKFPIITQRPIK